MNWDKLVEQYSTELEKMIQTRDKMNESIEEMQEICELFEKEKRKDALKVS